jgi:hypothetical protein
MQNWRRLAAGGLAYLGVLAGCALVGGQSSHGQGEGKGLPKGPEVTVVNTAANPVPVTGDVRVTNNESSPVPVALQGTAGIEGNVNVVNTPGVLITNPADSPALVRNVDAAIEAVQFGVNVGISPTFISGDAPETFTVPDDRRLVIEFVSARGQAQEGVTDQRLTDVLIGVPEIEPGGGPVGVIFHSLPFADRGLSAGAANIASLAQETRIYAEPGSTLTIRLARNTGEGHATGIVRLSGFLTRQP